MTTRKEEYTVLDFRNTRVHSFLSPHLGSSVISVALEITTVLSIDSRTLSYWLRKHKRQCFLPNYITVLKSTGSCIPKGIEAQMQQRCGAFLLILISVFIRKCHFKFFF